MTSNKWEFIEVSQDKQQLIEQHGCLPPTWQAAIVDKKMVVIMLKWRQQQQCNGSSNDNQ